MCPHGQDLRNYGIISPFNAKDFRKFLEIVCCCIPDREHCVTQPAHAEGRQFFIKEFHSKLTRQERNVFNDGQSDSPLFVFRKLNDGRKEGLGKKLDTDD